MKKASIQKVGALVLMAAMALTGIPAVNATHQQAGETVSSVGPSGWISTSGLDGSVAGVVGATIHRGEDGPAEPNYGNSRPVVASGTDGDRGENDPDATGNMDATTWDAAYGTATISGGHSFRSNCRTSTALTFEDEDLRDWASNPAANDYRFTENIADMGAVYNGGGGDLYFDVDWLQGIPVGDNFNTELRGLDSNSDGLSDYAQNYDPSSTTPRAPRVLVTNDAAIAWAFIELGTWEDLDGDSFVDYDPGGAANEFSNLTEDQADNIKGFMDPYNFITVDPDPSGGLGDAQDAIDAFLATFPTVPAIPDTIACPLIDDFPAIPLPNPGDPVSYVATLQNYINNELLPYILSLPASASACVAGLLAYVAELQAYITGELVPFLTDMIVGGGLLAFLTALPGNAETAAGGVVAGVTAYVEAAAGLAPVDTDPTESCAVEFGAISRSDGFFESDTNFLLDDDAGRQVTIVAWYDAAGDQDLSGTDDRTDIDQYCTDGQASGTSTAGTGATTHPVDLVCARSL